MATFHVCKLVLILNEEAAAVVAHGDRHVGDHVLEIALRHVLAEVTHILNEDLLETHAPHDLFVHAHWLIVFRLSLVLSVLEETLGKEVVFNALVMVVHRKDLLLFTNVLAPATAAATAATHASACRRIHPEQLLDAHGRYAGIRRELHQR